MVNAIVSHSSEQTINFGRALAKELRPPCLVLLEGELGSGKTTLAKGIVAGLGAAQEQDVSSPTFTMVHEYGQAARVYHVDLYRVEGNQDFETLGLEDLINQNAVVLVEWGEKFASIFPPPDFHIKLEHRGTDDRRITVRAGIPARTNPRKG